LRHASVAGEGAPPRLAESWPLAHIGEWEREFPEGITWACPRPGHPGCCGPPRAGAAARRTGPAPMIASGSLGSIMGAPLVAHISILIEICLDVDVVNRYFWNHRIKPTAAECTWVSLRVAA
jgi:hypothetical protein